MGKLNLKLQAAIKGKYLCKYSKHNMKKYASTIQIVTSTVPIQYCTTETNIDTDTDTKYHKRIYKYQYRYQITDTI